MDWTIALVIALACGVVSFLVGVLAGRSIEQRDSELNPMPVARKLPKRDARSSMERPEPDAQGITRVRRASYAARGTMKSSKKV